MSIASPTETASNASTDGPDSAWRASVGVSTIWRRSLVAMRPRFFGNRNALPAAATESQRTIGDDVPGSIVCHRAHRTDHASPLTWLTDSPPARFETGYPGDIYGWSVAFRSNPWPPAPTGKASCAFRS